VTIRALACDQTLGANFKATAEHRINYRLLRPKKSSNKASYLLEQAALWDACGTNQLRISVAALWPRAQRER
jgi:hypothetical protein